MRMKSRRGVVPPSVLMGITAAVLLVIGLGTGLTGLAVIPVAPAVVPSLHADLYYVNATGYNITTHTQIKALPAGSMIVTKVVINWGGAPVAYTAGSLGTINTGIFGFYRYHVVGSVAGPVAVFATVTAVDGKATYTATTFTTTVTVPGGTTVCTHLCVDVYSAFTETASGLVATFTDTSQVLNGTTTSYAWSFGDGLTGTGTPVVHSYGVAGSYLVGETVTAANATGVIATSSSSQNITVSAGPQPCQGTGPCTGPAPPFVTPTSGTFLGLGAGAAVWALAWGRPELGAVSTAAGGILGFFFGAINTGSFGL
jgi:PKD repeat protein